MAGGSDMASVVSKLAEGVGAGYDEQVDRLSKAHELLVSSKEVLWNKRNKLPTQLSQPVFIPVEVLYDPQKTFSVCFQYHSVGCRVNFYLTPEDVFDRQNYSKNSVFTGSFQALSGRRQYMGFDIVGRHRLYAGKYILSLFFDGSQVPSGVEYSIFLSYE